MFWNWPYSQRAPTNLLQRSEHLEQETAGSGRREIVNIWLSGKWVVVDAVCRELLSGSNSLFRGKIQGILSIQATGAGLIYG
jgi:hypothetical protein